MESLCECSNDGRKWPSSFVPCMRPYIIKGKSYGSPQERLEGKVKANYCKCCWLICLRMSHWAFVKPNLSGPTFLQL